MTARNQTNRAGKRRDRERNLRFESIREAAVRVFARNGYIQSTMDMIADEAELGRSSLYYYFSDKQTLYFNVIENALREVQRLIEGNITEDMDALRVLEAYFRTIIEYFYENSESLRLLMQLAVSPPDHVTEQLERVFASDPLTYNQRHMKVGNMEQLLSCKPGGELLIKIIETFILGLSLKSPHRKKTDLDKEVDYFLDIIRSVIPNAQEKNPKANSQLSRLAGGRPQED